MNNENKLGNLNKKEMLRHLLALKQFAGENNNNVKVHISGHMSVPFASCQLSKKSVLDIFLSVWSLLISLIPCQDSKELVHLSLYSIEVENMENEPSFQESFPDLPSCPSQHSLGVLCIAWSTDVHVCVHCTCGLLSDVTHSK